MQGNLSQISLNDILLLATGGKKTGVLRLSRGKETVEVYLNEGNIVHATCPIGDGEKALLYPVTWGEGTFALLPNGSPPAATIQKSPAEILGEVQAMTREWETILEVIPNGKTVFRIADLGEDQTGPITVPHVGWRVLSKIDGSRTVQEIADLLRIPYAYTAKVIFNLYKSGLVETVTPAARSSGNLVPPAVFQKIAAALTEVMGPMAPLVLRDQIEALGESEESFPDARLDELIGLLGREIPDGKLRHAFEESMLQEMSNFKRF
ncbi:MAG TPA: DUF4388 domain-containing protein [candidate division Zixibacteria bacterium]|nr:DUF4388 domain-containing protein [candidate division Zixibacteria bacterium]